MLDTRCSVAMCHCLLIVKDEDGYVFIMSRTDDVINVAGHRLSTGEMEEIAARHPAVGLRVDCSNDHFSGG